LLEILVSIVTVATNN